MTEHQVEVAANDDADRTIATLELAFASDPVMRWFWPSAATYRAAFPRFVRAIAGGAFDQGTAMLLEHTSAVALWLPPRFAADDDAITEVMLDTVDPGLLVDLSAFADLVREHHPAVDHWYLPFMGVDPVAQGRGLGARLLQHALAASDSDGVPAYLEASTVRSRLLYERFGFKEVGAIQVGASPRVWAMLRDPRPRSEPEGRRTG